MPKVKVYCQHCGFWKLFDTTEGKRNTTERYCNLCAEWQDSDTPVEPQRVMKNGDCHMLLNAKNNCPYYADGRVSEAKWKRTRILLKLKSK